MDTPLHVLLIEDEPSVGKLLSEMLVRLDPAKCIRVTQVSTLHEGHRLLESDGIDAVLLDLLLPDAQELEALHSLRKKYPYLAIVVISGIGHDIENDVLNAGACDYFSKGAFSGECLVRSIRRSYIRRRTWEKFAKAQNSLEETGRAIEDAKHIKKELTDSGYYGNKVHR